MTSNSLAEWDFKVYSKTTGQELEGNYCFDGNSIDGNMKKTMTLTHSLGNDLYAARLSLANRPNIFKEVTIDLRQTSTCGSETPLTPDQIYSLFTISLGFGGLSTDATIDQVTNSVLSFQNLDARIADFTNQVNTLNQELSSHGLNIQSFDENTSRKKIDKLRRSISASIAQKQALVTDITTQLTDISTKTDTLVTQSNTLTGLSEVISDYSFSTFNEFKEEADFLNSDFDDLVNSENTFGLVDASKTIAKESKLFKALTIKYIYDLLPESVSNANELEQYRDDQDYFDKIQSPRTLIKWLNHKIKAQNVELSDNQAKLSQDFEENVNDLLANQIEITGEYSENTFESLIESGILNPTTFEIDETKLEEGNNYPFTTQANRNSFNIKELSAYDILLDTYVSSKQQIGGYVKTAVNYYAGTETYQKYATPVVNKITQKYNALSPETKSVIEFPLKAHAALNKLIERYGSDKIALLVAKSKYTNWSALTPDEQRERVAKSKELLADVVNVDNLAVAGAAGLRTASGLALFNKSIKATKEIAALNIEKIGNDVAKLTSLTTNSTGLPIAKRYGTKIAARQRGSTGINKRAEEFGDKFDNACKSGTCFGKVKTGMLNEVHISEFAPDWGQKRAHVKLDKLRNKEVQLIGDGQGNLIVNSVFKKDLNTITNKEKDIIKDALSDKDWVDKIKHNISGTITKLQDGVNSNWSKNSDWKINDANRSIQDLQKTLSTFEHGNIRVLKGK